MFVSFAHSYCYVSKIILSRVAAPKDLNIFARPLSAYFLEFSGFSRKRQQIICLLLANPSDASVLLTKQQSATILPILIDQLKQTKYMNNISFFFVVVIIKP